MPQVSFNLGDVAQPGPWWEGAAGAFLALAAGGALVAALVLGALEALAVRHRRNIARSARVALYAQLHRAVELTHGWIEHAADPDRPRRLWMSLADLHLPTPLLLDQVRLLGPREIYEVTSFLYAYTEEVALLYGPAGVGAKAAPEAGVRVFGYDLDEDTARDHLLEVLRRINTRARRARNTLGQQVKLTYPKHRELFAMVDSHAVRDQRRQATAAAD